ncbi:MAG: helix-turn-helix domain-containing protein, partial [Peptostreptococcaceae bacterium]|nr:helix-turn-helix domain-containing protein [Peptostreptococcaceae bacterium]
DVDNAIKESYDKGLLDKTDLEIIRLLRKGMLKEDISKKKNLSRSTVYRRLEKIVCTVKSGLNKQKKV